MSRTPAARETPRQLPEALRGAYGVRQRQYAWLYAAVFIPMAIINLFLFIYIGSWLFAVCLTAVFAIAIAVIFLMYRGVDVELKADEVVLYRGAAPRRRISWGEVRAVNVQDRWREEMSIDLAEEQDVPLRGVDEKTARDLAEWFQDLPPVAEKT